MSSFARRALFALLLIFTNLVWNGEAFGWPPVPRRVLNLPILPKQVDIPPSPLSGPPSWSNNSKIWRHVCDVELSQDAWPKPEKFGVAPPRISGGGHLFDPMNPRGLPYYLGTLVSAKPSKGKGLPKFEIGKQDVGVLVRNHFGIPLDLSLDTPFDMWQPGVVTRNCYDHANGVRVLNIPEQLHTPAYWRTLKDIDYQNSLYAGGIPGDRSLFRVDHLDEQGIKNLLARLREDPAARVTGNTLSGELCFRGRRYTVEAKGYPSTGWNTFYPTINQYPNLTLPQQPFNQGPYLPELITPLMKLP